jgi:carboxyl-terminal processing protease
MNNMTRFRKIIIIVGIVVLIFGAYGFGWSVGKGDISISSQNFIPTIINKNSSNKQVDFRLFWNVWDLVEQRYVGTIDYQKMLYGAISGMVNSLGDPYTVFMTPDEAANFSQELKGVFEGIGAEIGMKNDKLTIIAPLENSPAQKAGLLSGDMILKINDQDTQGMSLSDAVSKIRGPKGTEVKLLVNREGFTEPKEYKITRGVIEVQSVTWEMKGNIAYIKIRSFDADTAAKFKAIIPDIIAKNPKGIVLDLRNNPGGYLDSSVEVASKFIPDGAIVYEQTKDGKKKEYKALRDANLANYKLVVLVNKGSASASEILAGAIADHKKGTLVGEKTFGKGSVQEVDELTGGSALRITIAHWLTPLGKSINDQGINPDIEVKMTDQDYNAGRDPQLDKALQLLQ